MELDKFESNAEIQDLFFNFNGIGKEDFVLIKLPRGVQPVLALVGVWKAGAACTIVEDNYAEERGIQWSTERNDAR